MTYGPLLNRATQVVFEGVPTHPNPDRCWEVSSVVCQRGRWR